MSLSPSRRTRDLGVYLLLVGPAFVIYVSVVAYPVLFSVGLGFTNYNFLPGQEARFVGLEQYRRMLADPRFWIGFRNNLIVVAVSVLGQIPIGFALAYILYRGHVRFRHFFQAMVFLPQAISLIVVGILWRNMFGVQGAATEIVSILTGNPSFRFTWFLRPETAMIPVAIALLWIYVGFYLIVFLANLQTLDESLIEAAQIDGASELQIFGRIVAPSMAGVILVNTILAISGSFKGFDLIFAIAPNQGMGIANYNLVLPTYMYHYAFLPQNYAFGSAISNVIVLLSVCMIVFARFVHRRFSVVGGYAR